MNIYDNGIKTDERDPIERGFVTAMVDDAENNLKDESSGGIHKLDCGRV